jgi:hypothetical protein
MHQLRIDHRSVDRAEPVDERAGGTYLDGSARDLALNEQGTDPERLQSEVGPEEGMVGWLLGTAGFEIHVDLDAFLCQGRRGENVIDAPSFIGS